MTHGTSNRSKGVGFRAGFRVARAVMDEAPAEKIIDIDDNWFDGHTGTGKTFHRLFRGCEPSRAKRVNVESRRSWKFRPSIPTLATILPHDVRKPSGVQGTPF
jgi:hypothetical protein